MQYESSDVGGMLSPHFALAEFTVSQEGARRGLRNQPLGPALRNLQRLAQVLEQLRTLLGGVPITITSGYRSGAINTLVGGALNSAHLSGLAADLIAPQFGTPRRIAQAVADSPLVFDQLIQEGTWLHFAIAPVGQPPRRSILTAVFAAGQKTTYLQGLA